jgi:alpha-L-fucosidase 2
MHDQPTWPATQTNPSGISGLRFDGLAAQRLRWTLLLFCVLSHLPCAEAAATAWAEPRVLWYDAPAKVWTEALPVGNGRLGAMVFGAYPKERIQLNEDSIWAIDPLVRHPAATKDYIARVQQLVDAGKFVEADALYRDHVIMADAGRIGSFQTMGDLAIEYVDSPAAESEGYHRQLDLATGLCSARHVLANGAVITEQVLSSAVDNCMAIRLESSAPAGLSFDLGLTRPTQRNATARAVGADTLELEQHNRDAENDEVPSTSFRTLVKALPDGGTVQGMGDRLQIRKANAVTVLITCATDFDRKNPRSPLPDGWQQAADSSLAKAAAQPWPQLRTAAANDLAALMHRCDIEIGTSPEAVRELPVNERITRMGQAGHDPDLQELHFQYGRYLLASSSRPGTLPANLQGLWAEKMHNPWEADYHLNINIQMNYWLAGMTGLPECEMPLFWLLDALRPEGRLMARAYGAKGFCTPHATNPWGRCVTTAHRVRWGGSVVTAHWVAFHLMEHYRFTGDQTFLRETAEPILRESCEFILSWVVQDPKTGKWVGKASASHEIGYALDAEGAKAGRDGEIGLGPATAYDLSIFAQILGDYLEAAEILGINDGFSRQVGDTLANLETPRIGTNGQILEWGMEVVEHEPNHWHLSHLIGAYPGSQITPQKMPALYGAAKVSLIQRGPGGSGWDRAWRACQYARFFDGDTAQKELSGIIGLRTTPNLLGKTFQLDGNFGAVAAMVELLLQSHDGEVNLLPALPTAWKSGSVRGVVARGGFVVDMTWRDGRLVQADIVSRLGHPLRLRYGAKTAEYKTSPGQSFALDGELEPL